MLVALRAPAWMSLGVSALLLITCLALVVMRPRGLHVAWFAGGGAVIAFALGLLSLATLGMIVRDTWDAVVTLIALCILAETLDANGFFTWAALCLARAARGSGRRLFALTLIVTTVVAALLANDGAILMLTPIFARLLVTIYPERRLRLPYLFALGFFADAMSALFVPSNLTNIIIADASGLNATRAALWMALPVAVAFVAAGAAFAARFRRPLAARYDTVALGEPYDAIHDHLLFGAGWLALGVLVAGYVAGSVFGWPVASSAGPVALGLLALTAWRKGRPVSAILRSAPWTIIIYAGGMFALMSAAYRAGALTFLIRPLTTLLHTGGGASALAVSGTLAGLSAIANNLPAALVGVLALPGSGARSLAMYAAILGLDIGSKLTPFGSLATLLWFDLLKRNGVTISWGQYTRENWWVALLALSAALGALLLVAALS